MLLTISELDELENRSDVQHCTLHHSNTILHNTLRHTFGKPRDYQSAKMFGTEIEPDLIATRVLRDQFRTSRNAGLS
jgi:hypothetical protein